MKIGDLLKQRRNELNLTLREVANISSVSYHLLFQIENSHNKTSQQTLLKLSNAYQIELNVLIELNKKSRTAYHNFLNKHRKDMSMIIVEPKLANRIHRVDIKKLLKLYKKRLKKYNKDLSFLRRYEIKLVERALSESECKHKIAAQNLMIPPCQLSVKLKKYNIIANKRKKTVQNKKVRIKKTKEEKILLNDEQKQVFDLFMKIPEQKRKEIILKGVDNPSEKKIKWTFRRIMQSEYKEQLIKAIKENQ